MCLKTPGRNYFRVLLSKNEWFQSRKEVLRCTLCFLDLLLYLFFTFLVILFVSVVYLGCTGLGYAILKEAQKPKELGNVEIWGLGFLTGLGILFGAGLMVWISFLCSQDWRKQIYSEEFILPENEYEKVGESNQTTLEP